MLKSRNSAEHRPRVTTSMLKVLRLCLCDIITDITIFPVIPRMARTICMMPLTYRAVRKLFLNSSDELGHFEVIFCPARVSFFMTAHVTEYVSVLKEIIVDPYQSDIMQGICRFRSQNALFHRIKDRVAKVLNPGLPTPMSVRPLFSADTAYMHSACALTSLHNFANKKLCRVRRDRRDKKIVNPSSSRYSSQPRRGVPRSRSSCLYH